MASSFLKEVYKEKEQQVGKKGMKCEVYGMERKFKVAIISKRLELLGDQCP